MYISRARGWEQALELGWNISSLSIFSVIIIIIIIIILILDCMFSLRDARQNAAESALEKGNFMICSLLSFLIYKILYNIYIPTDALNQLWWGERCD